MKFVTLLFILLIPFEVFSYIPSFDMILSRMSRNHGYGFYFIEQEVVFPNEPSPIIVKEHWTIQSDNRIKLRVYGQGELENKLQITYVYDKNKKYFLDKDGIKKVSTKHQEWLHPYLFFRGVSDMKSKLFVQKIIPAAALKEDKLEFKDGKALVPEKKFLRLARTGGEVTYFAGIQSDQQTLHPAIWISQDQFHLNKVRLSTEAELTAKDYNRYLRGFWLPKAQTIHWGDNFIQVNLRRVKGLSGGSSLKKKILHSSLDSTNNKDITRIPNVEKIKEFYSRFR